MSCLFLQKLCEPMIWQKIRNPKLFIADALIAFTAQFYVNHRPRIIALTPFAVICPMLGAVVISTHSHLCMCVHMEAREKYFIYNISI